MNLRRITAFAALGGALCAGLGYYTLPLLVPLPAGLREDPPRGLLFTDREGRPVRRLLDGELRAEEPAAFAEFPRTLVEATLAAEDARFFSHGGVDFRSLARALRDAAAEGRFSSGASTVTQQTVKLASPPRRRSVPTKIHEILAARKLEMLSDKETILAAYLNRLPYGNQLTGARAAARGYFDKPLADLSVAEAAFLAGLPNRPSDLNPWRHPEAARQRQLRVLGRLRDLGRISEAQFAAARDEPLRLLPGPSPVFHAPHFLELVMQQEGEALAAAAAHGRPLRTTLDLDLQHFVEGAAAAELARLAREARERNEIQAAVVVLDNASGEVLALAGSRSFHGSAGGQINGAWRPRSAGSTLKPFAYALALERGFTPATVLADTPAEYAAPNGIWQPVNFDRRFTGPVPLRRALGNSLNVPAVKTLESLGGPAALHELLTRQLGFTGLRPDAAEYGLGLVLGNAEVRLLELTNAYACLARLGEHRGFRLLLDEGAAEDAAEGVGSAPRQGHASGTTLFDPRAAWLVADILSDPAARSESFGVHSPLDLPFRVAVKTGTSTDFRDNWTVGYTPDYTVGVWTGRFDNRPLNRVSGVSGAAPLFHRVMAHLHEQVEPRWYERPEGIVAALVDPLTGKRVEGAATETAPRARKELFLAEALPPAAGPGDYDAEGRALLPGDYAEWWESESHTLHGLAALAEAPPGGPGADGAPPLRILSPVEGTVAVLDPDLPGGGARFPLRAAGSGAKDVEWSSATLEIESGAEDGRHWLLLRPGEHEVTARDRRSGREATARFQVVAM